MRHHGVQGVNEAWRRLFGQGVVTEPTLVNPHLIRYSQSSAGHSFTDQRPLSQLVLELGQDCNKIFDVPVIRVYGRDGRIFTLDHRRLWAFREANRPIRAISASPEELLRELWKHTTKNEGESIVIRGARGGK